MVVKSLRFFAIDATSALPDILQSEFELARSRTRARYLIPLVDHPSSVRYATIGRQEIGMGRIDPYARSSCAARFQWNSPATAKVSVTHLQTYEHELFGVRKADSVYKLDHIDLLCKQYERGLDRRPIRAMCQLSQYSGHPSHLRLSSASGMQSTD